MGLFEFDNKYFVNGTKIIAGVDEAGRGPWAGPVVAAAVVLPANISIPGLNDSKKLSELKREALFTEIHKKAVSVSIGIIYEDIIDRVNILEATYLAMKEALSKLDQPPDLVLVDGWPIPGLSCAQDAIIGGDGKSASIAAASIIAKVTRDRLMVVLSDKYPAYNFKKHKGYGTKEHQAALLAHGPCSIHRKSFAPIRKCLNEKYENG
jgi:ribonuclease HII